MKKPIIMLIAGLIIGAMCCYDMLLMTRLPFSESPEETVEIPEPEKLPRESITFILGEDRDTSNLYYQEAAYYYKSHPHGRTTYLVTTCASLLEVRDYLENNKPSNGLPWGLVNLVSHGNQWTGLSARITPTGKRTTAHAVEEAINMNSFVPLSSSVADSKTEIFLRGCGLGNHHRLVKGIARLLGGNDYAIIVRASRLFEYYTSVWEDGVVKASQRYLADAWYVTYRMGERPSRNELMNELHEKYPLASVNWHDALSRTAPRWAGDSYHYTFEVPVRTVIPINDFPSDEASEKKQLEWLRRQKKIMEHLTTLNIPFEKFTWSFRKGYVTDDDGKRMEAVAVKGYSTILCVLKALTHDSDSKKLSDPFVPHIDDSYYYYSNRASAPTWLVDVKQKG